MSTNLHPLTEAIADWTKTANATRSIPWGPESLAQYEKIRSLADTSLNPDEVSQVVNELTECNIASLLRELYGELYQRYEVGVLTDVPRPYSLETIFLGGGYVKDMLSLSIDEYRYARAKHDAPMLFIGSGAIPLAILFRAFLATLDYEERIYEAESLIKSWNLESESILLKLAENLPERAEQAGFKATGVDIDPRMVEYATNVIEDLGLSNVVEIKEGSGEMWKSSIPFSLLLVAGNVTPRDAVLKNFLSQLTSKSEFALVLRTVSPFSLGELLYDPFGPGEIASLLNNFPMLRHSGSYPPLKSPAIYATTHTFHLK